MKLATQLFAFDIRASDSPFIEKIWRTRSVPVETFISAAEPHWEMVVTTRCGNTEMTIRGPETRATIAAIPQDAEFVGIQFRLGTFLRQFPLQGLVDSGITLPCAGPSSFWLDSSAWQFPGFENAETFIEKLAHRGLLVRESDGQSSERTAQRQALRATGLSRRAIRQIERAQRATELIQRGTPFHDTVWRAGYTDQAHLTRALKRYVGMTPRQLAESFKTSPGR